MAAARHSVRADGPAVTSRDVTKPGVGQDRQAATGPSREPADSDGQRYRRGLRYDLRDRGRDVTTLDRFAACGRHRVPGAEGVTVRLSHDGVASYGNVQTCGLIWACPVCSAKIRQERADRVEVAGRRHVDQGGGLAFGTLTVPHDFGDDLAATLGIVREAWRRTRQNSAVRRLWKRLGLRGFVRALEITWSPRNGWHPHVHVLWFTAAPLTAAQLLEVGDVVHAAWAAAAQVLGLRMPTREHGVRVQGVGRGGGASALAAYLTKVQDSAGDSRSVGAEMTRGDLKRGRKQSSTPFELLERATAGDRRARLLWRDYERATTGARCIEASRGLLADLGVDEPTDEELAAAPAPAEVVLTLTDEQWRRVLLEQYGRRRLLELVEDGGAATGRYWLERLVLAADGLP